MMIKLEQKKEQAELLTVAHHDFEKGLNARAFFRLHNKALSQDVVQNTFLKTWLYLVKGGKIHMMKAFLYHILNNLIVDEYRKHKNSSLDDLVEKGFEPKDNSHERILNLLDGKVAMLLIQRLPEKYRKVLEMHYKRMLSIEEISLITGQTKNAVAVQIHRGLEKLRQLYKEGYRP